VAKLLVHGRDRAQTLVRARRALDEPEVEGVSTSPQAGFSVPRIELASPPAAFAALSRAHEISDLDDVLQELRDISSGLHPAALSHGGLQPGLNALARRSPIPVALDVGVSGRLAEPVEIAAYYLVAEMLTNAAKHANASHVDVTAVARDGALGVCVRDDGVGGADPAGSGLVGLSDRVQALGGTMTIDSPPGAGTTLVAELPCRSATRP
jgi:signal transduction histidine kinase